MLRPLYEQYEFCNMCVHPVTFLFKAALLGVILYVGEPNSLNVIMAAALVEMLQLLFYALTEPFISAWIDLLGKSGPLHQVIQLALLCVYRADTFNDPESTRAVIFMIVVTCVYMSIVLLVIAVVVVAPMCASDTVEEDEDAGVDDAEPIAGSSSLLVNKVTVPYCVSYLSSARDCIVRVEI